MKIVDTMAISGRCTTCSPEFKPEIVAKCREPGTSVARIALVHGINANVVRRWLREAASEVRADVPIPTFVPVTFTPPERPPVPPAKCTIRPGIKR